MIACGGQMPSVAGFVLAGGRSSRMGTDKALVEFAGQPLICHALAALREAGLSAAIAGARSDLRSYAPVIADAEQDLGPLSGICNALASTAAAKALFVPVDLPLLPASLIRYLAADAQITDHLVTLVSVNGFPQTFPVVVSRGAFSILKLELDAGRSGCFAALRAAAAQSGQTIRILPLEYLAQSGAVAHPGQLIPSRWFQNLNTPGDLDCAITCGLRRIA